MYVCGVGGGSCTYVCVEWVVVVVRVCVLYISMKCGE